MKSTQKLEKLGTNRVGIIIEGKKSKPEPCTVTIDFPGGFVEVSRANDDYEDPDYWVHISCVHPDGDDKFDQDGEKRQTARILNARLDLVANRGRKVNLGDLKNPALQHVAVRVCRGATPRELKALGKVNNKSKKRK